MNLVNNENDRKIIYIENMVSNHLEEIKKIRETSEFSSDPKLVNDLINLYLNMISYTISLNYYYSKPSSRVLSDLRNELGNLFLDFSLILNPHVSITPRELIENPPPLDINPEQRFLVIKKLGYIIDLIKELHKGDFKASFSLGEFYLKFIVFSKNIIDFKNLAKNLMPDSPYYKYQARHLKKVLNLLEEGAFLLRTNYELKKYEEYAKQSLQYLEAGKILAILTTQKEDIEQFSKMHEVWSSKFNSDLSNKKK